MRLSKSFKIICLIALVVLCVSSNDLMCQTKEVRKSAPKEKVNVLAGESDFFTTPILDTKLILELTSIYDFLAFERMSDLEYLIRNRSAFNIPSEALSQNLIEASLKDPIDLKVAYSKTNDGKLLKDFLQRKLNSYKDNFILMFRIDRDENYSLGKEEISYDIFGFSSTSYQEPFSILKENRLKNSLFVRGGYSKNEITPKGVILGNKPPLDPTIHVKGSWGVYLENLIVDKYNYLVFKLDPKIAVQIRKNARDSTIGGSFLMLLCSFERMDEAVLSYPNERKSGIIVAKIRKIAVASIVKNMNDNNSTLKIIYERRYLMALSQTKRAKPRESGNEEYSVEGLESLIERALQLESPRMITKAE